MELQYRDRQIGTSQSTRFYNSKQRKIAMLIDIAVPNESNVKKKEGEKLAKYLKKEAKYKESKGQSEPK